MENQKFNFKLMKLLVLLKILLNKDSLRKKAIEPKYQKSFLKEEKHNKPYPPKRGALI